LHEFHCHFPYFSSVCSNVFQSAITLLPFPSRRGFEPVSSRIGTVMDRAALGQVLSDHFCFLCHSFIPLIAPQSSPSIIHGWYNRPINGCSHSGLCFTPAP
jgi:hypothetical protein